VAVHKRLGTPEVASCQLSQRAPKSSEFAARAKRLLAAAPEGRRKVLFLATDDAHAVAAFQEAFPASGEVELSCRSGVKRSEGGVRADGVDNEVHRSPCQASDAEDALIDALCLSRCEDFVCIDSNVAIFVALTNPDIGLHPLNDILPEGWEEESARPTEVVYEAYEVVFKPMVFIRKGPSAATELLSAKKFGEVVRATGRLFDGWVEIEEGGWMMVDAEQMAESRGKGLLLKPAGPALPGVSTAADFIVLEPEPTGGANGAEETIAPAEAKAAETADRVQEATAPAEAKAAETTDRAEEAPISATEPLRPDAGLGPAANGPAAAATPPVRDAGPVRLLCPTRLPASDAAKANATDDSDASDAPDTFASRCTAS